MILMVCSALVELRGTAMQSLWDFLDNYIYGPLNYIDRIEGFFKRIKYRDAGHTFVIPRYDKGGKYPLSHVEDLLNRYGIVVFCRTIDANNHYFQVKNRQTEWAEYLMLLKGVELQGPLINEKNAWYAVQAPIGWMPQPWLENRKGTDEMDDEHDEHNTQQVTPKSFINTVQNFMNWD